MSDKIHIAVYGLGPASIFFLEDFINTDIQLHVFEHGKSFSHFVLILYTNYYSNYQK